MRICLWLQQLQHQQLTASAEHSIEAYLSLLCFVRLCFSLPHVSNRTPSKTHARSSNNRISVSLMISNCIFSSAEPMLEQTN